MLSGFPKRRPDLPDAYRALYERLYKENREGASTASSLAQRMEAWMHRRVARDVRDGVARPTLEIGAGTLNHLPYEPPGDAYDVVEPFRSLFEGSPRLARVRHVYADVADVPADRRYARILSVATFEHVCDLPAMVARATALLEPAGVLRVAIPSEGGWLWRLGWTCTTGLEFRLRHGLDYGVIMRHEHVNTAAEVEAVLEHFFADVRIERFGLGRHLSLYEYLECRRPRLERCAPWAEGRAGSA